MCIAKKILSVRLFENPATGKRWDKSVKDLDLEVMCVSQFTLYHILKVSLRALQTTSLLFIFYFQGNKPDFHLAMAGDDAKNMYHDLVSEVKKNYVDDKIKNGLFGALMEVNIANDGPVTIEIESMNKESPRQE